MANQISETSKVGKRGSLVIPVKLRQRFGLKEGSLVIVEETSEGILIRPAVAVPTYTQEQLEDLILEGLESGEATEMTQDWKDLRQLVRDEKKSN